MFTAKSPASDSQPCSSGGGDPPTVLLLEEQPVACPCSGTAPTTKGSPAGPGAHTPEMLFLGASRPG